MKHKIILFITFFTLCLVLFLSCTKNENTQPIRFVFLPNESNDSMKDAREAFKAILEEATGKNVEIKTTTDYNIALEALISGKADMAYVGAEGYINAHKRNPAIVPLVTNSGPSGTLNDAMYYSFIAVRTEDADNYKSGAQYDLTKLKGKTISFVSTSSTSGFVIPAALIASKFGLANTDALIQEKDVFDKILFYHILTDYRTFFINCLFIRIAPLGYSSKLGFHIFKTAVIKYEITYQSRFFELNYKLPAFIIFS